VETERGLAARKDRLAVADSYFLSDFMSEQGERLTIVEYPGVTKLANLDDSVKRTPGDSLEARISYLAATLARL
jgi:hypothetical protein